MGGAIVNKGVKVRDPFSIRTHKNVGKVNCLPGENRGGLVLKHEPRAHCSPNMQKKTIINIISSKESFFTIVPPLIPPLPCQPCEMPPPVHHVLLHCLSFATFRQVRLNYSLWTFYPPSQLFHRHNHTRVGILRTQSVLSWTAAGQVVVKETLVFCVKIH